MPGLFSLPKCFAASAKLDSITTLGRSQISSPFSIEGGHASCSSLSWQTFWANQIWGVTTGFVSGLYARPPTLPLIGFSIRPVSDSVQCLLWSGGTFSVASSQSSLSLAMEDYCFNQPDIVNYPFHWSEEAGKDKSNFATLAFDLGHKPQASGLELHDLWKVPWLSSTAKTLFLSERKDKETDFKRFKVLLK